MTTQTATLTHAAVRRTAPSSTTSTLRMLVDAYREAIELQRDAQRRWPHMEG